MGKPTRYRKIRRDLFHHEKMGLSPVALSVWLQATLGPSHGVLERSLSKMATVASGRRPGSVTVSQIADAIEELTACHRCAGATDAGWCGRCSDWVGVAWWPELEMLWVVEAADEQCANPSMWQGTLKEADTLPHQVRDAFRRRYADRYGAEAQEPEPQSQAAPRPQLVALAEQVRTKEAAAKQKAVSVEGFIHDLRYEIEPIARKRKGTPSPFVGGQAVANLASVLEQYGAETVRHVILHTVKEFVEGKIPSVYLGRMFGKEGGGFQARLEEWAKAGNKLPDKAKIATEAIDILGTI